MYIGMILMADLNLHSTMRAPYVYRDDSIEEVEKAINIVCSLCI